MDKKTILIIGSILIIIAVILISYASFTDDTCEKTNLTITSDKNLTNGDIFSVKLKNESGNGIANKTININITDSNNNSTTVNVTTDSQGNGNFTINLSADNYTVNASFTGDKNYNSSYTLQNLTIYEVIVETNNYESTSETSTSSQSDSSGNDGGDGEIVYSTDPNSDKSVLDENGHIDQDKVDYDNKKASEKYGPIG